MRRLSGIIAILLLLVAAAPALACVTGRAMNSTENACCRDMHGKCGDMAKMGCCRTEVRTDQSPQVAPSFPTIEVHWVYVAQVAPLPAAPKAASVFPSRLPSEHSPPGLLLAKTTVLRI